MPLRALTILLMVAASFPPPRVVNIWIAQAQQPAGSIDLKKPLPARGRNRISTQVSTDTLLSLAPRASGIGQAPRVSRYWPHRLESALILNHPRPFSLSWQSSLRLRC